MSTEGGDEGGQVAADVAGQDDRHDDNRQQPGDGAGLEANRTRRGRRDEKASSVLDRVGGAPGEPRLAEDTQRCADSAALLGIGANRLLVGGSLDGEAQRQGAAGDSGDPSEHRVGTCRHEKGSSVSAAEVGALVVDDEGKQVVPELILQALGYDDLRW